MDLRARRRDERRHAVMEVALELFDERGYEDTTVEVIAAAAGISPRSFYRYFEAKDGVLGELGTQLVEEALARLAAQGRTAGTAGDLARRMAEVADEWRGIPARDLQFRLFRERPELVDRAGGWRERWVRLVADRLAEWRGAAGPSFEELVVARLAVTLMASAVDRWLATGGEVTLADSVESVIAVSRAELLKRE